jgi:hypothetical protein
MTIAHQTPARIPEVDFGVHHEAYGFADVLAGRPAATATAPCPEHADEIRLAA